MGLVALLRARENRECEEYREGQFATCNLRLLISYQFAAYFFEESYD